MSDDSMTPTNTDANNEPKLSPVELIKDASRYLRGSIGSELLSDSNHFGKDDLQLLKFHGTYQQDDREQRKSSGESGKSEKEYSFMVRTRIPAGIMTAQQLLAHLDLCDTIGNSTLKITTRQGLQLHGILKQDLRECMQKINQCMLTTLAACGDVNRNTMACPAPYNDSVRATVQKLAQDISDHLSPRTQSYYELWLKDLTSGQETLEGGSDQLVEPIYGKTYLPRKFKTAIALADDNCTDVYTNCLGFIAVVRDGQVIGYNVVVGGGLGVTPSAKKTFPRLASRMAFVTPEQAVGVAEAVVKVQRDFGYRDDRKRARLKYLVHDQGIEWMRHKVEEYYGTKLKDCTPDDVIEHRDHMGWDEQGDGRCFYGFNVENGRLYDDDQRATPLVDRLCCFANLWPCDHRKRESPARCNRRDGEEASGVRLGQRALYGANDRLSQRLRKALQRRYWVGRKGQRQVHRLCRWHPFRYAFGVHLQRPCATGEDHR